MRGLSAMLTGGEITTPQPKIKDFVSSPHKGSLFNKQAR